MEEKSTVSVMESAESVESVHGECGESAAYKQDLRGISHAARWLER